ncbi:DNA repair protein RAD51 homolog 4 isoform X1 [Ornithorhynchus anatinus]|uniref:DNA repair protein RAD51 homolog 4 isoform X1 n=1 Tax=Ornithorhynchus anatinus TaxID=9258 RepID=UPI0010A94943|nr:DNA repair protein RAD51 homolog 4 isoform X1 [Ornithorhynchus anatinus]
MAALRAGLCPGLTDRSVRLLREHGIRTVVDLVSARLEEVSRRCGLSYKALVAARRVLLAQFSALPLSGADVYEELAETTAILPTGLPGLDRLLDSGLYTGEVAELTGAPGSGKTQVCLCAAASVAHGLGRNVLFLDSTGGFTAARLLQLLRARTRDEEEQAGALRRIRVERSFDAFGVLDALQDLRGSFSRQRSERCSARSKRLTDTDVVIVRHTGTGAPGPVKMLVLDSVSAVISPLLGGRQSEGLAVMTQLARELKTLAREFGLAVVVTNHLTRDRETGRSRPGLGRSWSFVPSTRVVLEGAGPRRTARLAKSPRQPTGIQEALDLETWGSPATSPSPEGS